MSLPRGDRIPVRVEPRVVQTVGQGIDIGGFQMVFRLVGLAMPIGCGHARFACQPGFVQAVRAHHLDGIHPPVRSQMMRVTRRRGQSPSPQMPQNLRRLPPRPRQGPGQTVHRGSAPGFATIEQMLQRIFQLDPVRAGRLLL